jgi:hypothetical protein
MRQHLDAVAWLYIGMGLLGILSAFLVFGGLGLAGVLSGDMEAASILAVIGVFAAGVVALLSAPSILGGWGLLRRKPWARVLVLILSFLNLFAFPVGTLVGGYAIWVLMNDEAKAILEGRL